MGYHVQGDSAGNATNGDSADKWGISWKLWHGCGNCFIEQWIL